jgi:hypothetical protein
VSLRQYKFNVRCFANPEVLEDTGKETLKNVDIAIRVMSDPQDMIVDESKPNAFESGQGV